jgi:Flp pilus assembly protein TadD
MEKTLDPEPFRELYADRPRIDEGMIHLRRTISTGAKTVADDGSYIEMMQEIIRQNVQMDLATRRFRTGLARSKRLAMARSGAPDDLSLLAEAYYFLGPRTESPASQEWTASDRRKAAKQLLKQTEEEEYRALAATPKGQAALKLNQTTAENLFRRAIGLDANLARPHFGLGMLYERMGRAAMALDEYRKYLELAPHATDRLRAERRIETLTSTPKAP